MKDFAAIADEVLDLGISPLFRHQTGKALPPRLGRSLLRTIRVKLSQAGVSGQEHTEDVFFLFVARICDHLRRHSAADIEEPVAYLHQTCRNTASRYIDGLRARRTFDTIPLEEGLEQEVEAATPAVSERQIVGLIKEALPLLKPRHRQLIWLDVVEGLEAPEIQARLGIESGGYFRKLKCNAFKELDQVLLSVNPF